MSDEKEVKEGEVKVESSRFGELVVPESSIIDFPVGVVGFPNHKRYVMIEHTPPFSWLQSLDDAGLAFVIIDALEFGDNYVPDPPKNDTTIDLHEDDEFAVLVIVTVRPDPKDTTANLKAPLFVNLKNRKGVQIIYDNPKLTTRHPLWTEDEKESEEKSEEK